MKIAGGGFEPPIYGLPAKLWFWTFQNAGFDMSPPGTPSFPTPLCQNKKEVSLKRFGSKFPSLVHAGIKFST